MHSTVLCLSLEKYGMFRKEINHRGKFISHIQFGNGSPTVENFYKRKLKSNKLPLYNVAIFMPLCRKKFIMQIRTYNNLTLLYNVMKIET